MQLRLKLENLKEAITKSVVACCIKQFILNAEAVGKGAFKTLIQERLVAKHFFQGSV